MSGPQRRRFIFPGGGLGAHFRVPLIPAVEVSQEKGDGVAHRFWRQQRSVPHLWPWSESETARLGAGLPPQVNMISPGKFPIFREDYQSKLYLHGFLYTNDMEKLTKGRIVASYRCSRLGLGLTFCSMRARG